MKQRTVDLSDPQVQRLAIEAGRRGISVAELIRRFVDQGLDACGTPWPEHRQSTCEAPAEHLSSPPLQVPSSSSPSSSSPKPLTLSSPASSLSYSPPPPVVPPFSGEEEAKPKRKRVYQKREEPEPEIPVHLDTPGFRKALGEWLEYKTERRQGYKPIGLRNLLRSLGEWEEQTVIKAIQRALSNNNQGIFPESVPGARRAPGEASPSSPPPPSGPSLNIRRRLVEDVISRACSSGLIDRATYSGLIDDVLNATSLPELDAIEGEIQRRERERNECDLERQPADLLGPTPEGWVVTKIARGRQVIERKDPARDPPSEPGDLFNLFS